MSPDQRRDLGVIARAATIETLRGRAAVPHLAVLAHLPLALEPRDLETEADDAAQHHVDVALGRVADLPGLRLARLLLSGQFADVTAQPVLVLHDRRPA